MDGRDSVRLMAIDDEPFMLRLLERMLDQLGYTAPSLCQGAQQALRELDQAQQPPQLILLDLAMPEMDGI